MSLKLAAQKSIFWTALEQFGTQGIQFVVTIIMARILFPEDFGLMAMLTIFVGVGSAIIKGGLDFSLIRTEETTNEDYNSVFYYSLLSGIVIYLTMCLGAGYIAEFFKSPVLENIIYIYGLSFLFIALGFVPQTILTKKLDFKKQFKASLPAITISSIIGILLAYKGFGVWALVWSSLTYSFIYYSRMYYFANWKPTTGINFILFKKHYKFGYKLMISSITYEITKNLYNVIIGRYFAANQLGFYEKANSLKQLPVNNISAVLNRVTYPIFSKLQQDKPRLKRYNKKLIRTVIYVICPILLLGAALAEPLFIFVLTEKWRGAIPYFQILCLNGILYPLHSYNLNILNVLGQSGLFLKLSMFKQTIFLLITLISFNWGIFGLLWGSVVFSIIAFFINAYYSGRNIDYFPMEQLKDISPFLVIGLLVSLAVYFLNLEYFHDEYSYLFQILTSGSIGLLVYIGICEGLKVFTIKEALSLVKK